ncbi:hypothetical protein D5085_03585 [Ectothiorhodospiraceae bacterium BW-2]|nr:hypothetical protein D5085_03585 [Ectothiorhodospiraceae bacterium BW-2]
MAKAITEEQQQRELREMLCRSLDRLDQLTEQNRFERHYHFRLTNTIVKISAALMLIVAVFNVLYAYDFYLRMLAIVDNISLLEQNTRSISRDMDIVVDTMSQLNSYMTGMEQINDSMILMSETMPQMNQRVGSVVNGMHQINTEMVQMSQNVQLINSSFNHIATGVLIMRGNVNQIAKPMGVMNPFMP